jgi:hypothetical protein
MSFSLSLLFSFWLPLPLPEIDSLDALEIVGDVFIFVIFDSSAKKSIGAESGMGVELFNLEGFIIKRIVYN